MQPMSISSKINTKTKLKLNVQDEMKLETETVGISSKPTKGYTLSRETTEAPLPQREREENTASVKSMAMNVLTRDRPHKVQ